MQLFTNLILYKGGTKIELGASWIHDILGNPLYELAVSHNLVEAAQVRVNLKYIVKLCCNIPFHSQPSKPHNVVATTEEGRRLPFPVLQEIYEAYFWFFKR